MYGSQIAKGTSGVVLLLLSFAAFSAPDPQAIEVGAGKLIPTLRITEKVDDNIFSQSDSLFSEKDSLISQIAPQIQYLAERDRDYIALTYTGDYGLYSDSSDDDYDDHTFSLDTFFNPSDLYSVSFGASFGKLHDNRGEGSSEGVIAASRTSPDEYEIGNVNVMLDIGSDSARFGVEAEVQGTNIEYTNNRSETVFRDRSETSLAVRFYGRAGGKTRYFVEYEVEDFSYGTDPIVGGKLDSNQQSFSVGVKWEATGKTTGEIKVGQLDKEFDANSRRDGDLTDWDINITWSPRTYSHVLFSASSAPLETNGTGSFIEARNVSLMWLHNWSDRLNSTVVVSTGDDDFDDNSRSDDRDNFSIGLSYDWQRWASVGVSYSFTERDSNINAFDFEKNIFSISLDMSL